MAKPRKTVAKKAAKKTIHRAAPRAATTDSPPAGATAMFAVLAPFKFRDAVVKPPAWIELTAAEAREYQDAEVLGTEPADVAGDTNASSEEGGTESETAE